MCMSTASGKSPTLCTFVSNLAKKFPNERFVISVHSQELVAQLAETYERVSGTKPAVYAAALKSKKIGQVTVCQTQSIYRHALKFGRIKLLVVDECDRIPVQGEGQYRTFIKEAEIVNPDLRIVGFTATPFRTGSGLVFGDGQPFDDMVFSTDIRQLIDEGYLSALVSKDGGQPDLAGVHSRQGDFVASELEAVMTDGKLVSEACTEICEHGANRKAWLVFASGLKHAAMVQEELRSKGVEAHTIHGSTPDAERKDLIARFRSQELRCLINVSCLTTGFDAPHVDLVALLRPTQSAQLFMQMVGRAFRIHPGKSNALILDMAGNIARHGPVDTILDRVQVKKKGEGVAPVKTCEHCQEIVAAGCRICPVCQHPFPDLPVAKHDPVASLESPLFSGAEDTMEVVKVSYSVHANKDPTKPATVKVCYRNGLKDVTEWLSVDAVSHPFARNKALGWVRETPKVEFYGRTLDVVGNQLIGSNGPTQHPILNASDFVDFAGCLAKPLALVTVADPAQPKYRRIIKRIFT